MIKKGTIPLTNGSETVAAIVSCAKKRRYLAKQAVRGVNSKLSLRSKFAVIK